MRRLIKAPARVTRQLPVACFYCDERFKRTQERATHIRHHHPGKAYRPDLEKQAPQSEVAPPPQEVPVARATAMVVANGQLVDVLAPPDEMTSKQHLVAAITSIKRRQEAIEQQVPELEKQLEALRAAQQQLAAERQALETALGSIASDVLEQIQGPRALAKAGD
jgi:hypothetical protein